MLLAGLGFVVGDVRSWQRQRTEQQRMHAIDAAGVESAHVYGISLGGMIAVKTGTAEPAVGFLVALAVNLGIAYHVVPIDDIFQSYLGHLAFPHRDRFLIRERVGGLDLDGNDPRAVHLGDGEGMEARHQCGSPAYPLSSRA